MAEIVTEQQREQAAREGYAAGNTLQPAMPNPYAPPHVPAWRQPRTRAGRVALIRQNAPARVLARMWRDGYRRGLDDQSAGRSGPGATAPGTSAG